MTTSARAAAWTPGAAGLHRASRAAGLCDGPNRLVGHPPLDVLGQRLAGAITVLKPHSHRPRQMAFTPGRLTDRAAVAVGYHPSACPQPCADIVILDRRLAGQQAVERGAQAVDVRLRPSISRSPQARAGLMYEGMPERAAGQRLGRTAG